MEQVLNDGSHLLKNNIRIANAAHPNQLFSHQEETVPMPSSLHLYFPTDIPIIQLHYNYYDHKIVTSFIYYIQHTSITVTYILQIQFRYPCLSQNLAYNYRIQCFAEVINQRSIQVSLDFNMKVEV